jgi:ribonuclease BN (tRNA processing enzyme)
MRSIDWMRVTVLGACGGWPEAGQACSGYLIEYDGFRLVLDLGYATMPRLLEHIAVESLGAVVVSHGHPDHCADLNPLLRARALGDFPAPPLPVYAPPGALDAVLALDRPGMLTAAYDLREFTPGEGFEIGPFQVRTHLLPHWVTNAGIRLTAGGIALAYTGDSGPSPEIARLSRDADLLLAEASYVDGIPEDARAYLSSAEQAGRQAADADVGRLLLTHLMPGTNPGAAHDAAAERYPGKVGVATAGLVADLSSPFDGAPS